MQGNPLRVVIDTNIWISFLIGKSLTGLSEAIISGQVIVLFSDDLFGELLEVLKRPKFKKYFSKIAIENLVALLYEKVELIEITHHIEDCLDAKDNFLLDLTVSGRANCLVTGDADLMIGVMHYRPFSNRFHGGQ
jgi:putative PIN family toxin of toxin-antitoxin system